MDFYFKYNSQIILDICMSDYRRPQTTEKPLKKQNTNQRPLIYQNTALNSFLKQKINNKQQKLGARIKQTKESNRQIQENKAFINKQKQKEQEKQKQKDNYYGIIKMKSEIDQDKLYKNSQAQHYLQYRQKIIKQQIKQKNIPIKAQEFDDREQAEENHLGDSMTQSTQNLLTKFVQQQKQQINTANNLTDIPSLTYFNHKFDQVYKKQQKTHKILELIREQLTFNQQTSKKPSLNQQKLKKQLQQAKTINQIRQSENKRHETQLYNLFSKLKQQQKKQKQLMKSLNEKNQLLNQKDLQIKQLNNRYNLLQSLYDQAIACNKKKVIDNSSGIQQFKFYSNLTIENKISIFIKQSIQSFIKKTIKTAKLIFKKDQFSKSISNYVDRIPYPIVILFTTLNNTIFGVFSQGIQTNKPGFLKSQKTIKTFIFNATTKTIIPNNSNSKVKCGLLYYENSLQFGNNELNIKSNNLNFMKVNGNSLFGQKYFNLQKRQTLTGDNKDYIQIRQIQIFQVFFQDN